MESNNIQLICTINIFFLSFFLYFAVRGPLAVVASSVAEHRLRTCRLSGHGSRAQPLRGMWDPPGPGHEPASTALAGGLYHCATREALPLFKLSSETPHGCPSWRDAFWF